LFLDELLAYILHSIGTPLVAVRINAVSLIPFVYVLYITVQLASNRRANRSDVATCSRRCYVRPI